MKQKTRFIPLLSVVVGLAFILPSSADDKKGTPVTDKDGVTQKSRKADSKQAPGSSKAKAQEKPQVEKSKTDKDKPAVQKGSSIYKQYCASCHADGGNSVKPSRPVAESKQIANIGIFKDYLSAPPGHMPYYQHLVNDRKTLQALLKYCQSLKRKPIKQANHASVSNGKI